MINQIFESINGLNKGLSITGKEKNNVEQINDNLFIFNLYLNNGSSRIGLKFSAIKELNIIDDLRYFFVYGTLLINYNNEPLESFESLGNGPQGPIQNTKPYNFRGDGRDLLEIEIMPQLKEQKCLEVYANEEEKRKYCIKHLCSIYKYEDITSGSGEKNRKFYFWDRDYQLLRELNINYSTADRFKNKKSFLNFNNSQIDISKSNTENSIYTGEAIEDILKTSLVDNARYRFNKGSWDRGGSKIFYSSSGQNNALDDLNFVLSYHMSDRSNDFLPCLLKKERYTEKYSLIPINKYMKSGVFDGIGSILNISSNNTEDFIVGKIDSTDSGSSVIPKSVTLKQIIPTDYNLISDYVFQKVDANQLQDYLSTQIVHGLDPRGFFNTNLKNNNYDNIKKTYEKTFVSSFKSGTGLSPSSNIPENQLRKEHKNVTHNFIPYSVDENQGRCFGINKSLINIFFKNTSIQFKVRGNTMRKTGNFFTVNRTDNNFSKTYDDTILGKYITTYVSHEFKEGNYETTILGIKPYSNESPNYTQTI
jgi:hypothetical protein